MDEVAAKMKGKHIPIYGQQGQECHGESASTRVRGEVGGWGRVPFSRNLMSPTPRRKWYLTTGRKAH